MIRAQPRKAVMLKGPSLTSKTFFVPLPDTLDQLVARAVQLFPVPPGKVPHITLGSDERAIILEESYDFIRDRELLHFRWSAETPRRNLANRVRWDQSAASTSANLFASTSSPQSSASTSDEVPLSSSSTASSAETLKAQLQGSPSSKGNVASTTRANTIANRDPNTQFGEGVAARKAHAQRVLAEQQRKREESHSADALGAAPILMESDQDVVLDTDPDATAKAALELAATLPLVDAAKDTIATATMQEDVPAVVENKDDASTVEIDDDQIETSSDAVPEVVLAPASVAMTIESPPRKKPVDNGGLDTPPSSGSRSSSPFHANERSRPVDHRMCTQANDEPSSSPISSPTRDVSSRFRNALSAMPVPELGEAVDIASSDSDKEQARIDAESSNGSVVNDLVATAILSANQQSDAAMSPDEDTRPASVSQTKEIETAAVSAPAPAAAPAATKPVVSQANDRELNRIYSFLSNLVSQLLSHKANWAFQRPMSVEFEQFSARSSRPVDLFTIRDSLASRKYGSQHLEGRMAANAVVTDFEDDLTLLYTNARRFFGVRSTQAECVEHLEKFSRSFLNEWKRTQGSAAQAKAHAGHVASEVASRLSQQRSPGSRSEKGPALLSSSPFPMLLTPGSSAAIHGAGGSTGKKTVGNNGQPLASTIGLMRRPDFGFKRNTSYEGTLNAAKRPTQPQRPTSTTSEAFERALRAATSTPQAERIKPRQEVVAPFATRSVIESDFMARLAPSQLQPQQQPQTQQADVSPTPAARTPIAMGSKRKLSEALLEASVPSAARSPSVSPPPSPSPTKRNKQQPVATPKPAKSASRRSSKKKARQAAAAAAAAAERATKMTEQKRGRQTPAGDAHEEQLVLELIDPRLPPAKRTRAARSTADGDADALKITSKAQSTGRAKAAKPDVAVDAAGVESSPGGRTLRSRRSSYSAAEREHVPPPKTPPKKKGRSSSKYAHAGVADAQPSTPPVSESMDLDGFEVMGSCRRSARQRKPVNLD
ncbi:hypothetical protein EX895_004324 [Sporisorium graminicola]|uniref:Bromo domain-containing protein n=1 Tax=Sporisorium graminicola TaxID=280036 RepID=A0A4U7KQL3_9BASI|nr:hypothetical protein EX895_004324 [Sporisorium graminicola]TKY86684.1 hypothetical protein EX895_004324 [Sporisorium graminicola]